MKPAFLEISKIAYEGLSSKNPLAFKQYDSAKVIENRTMAEHLRFSVAYWHTFRNTLSDPFGAGTAIRHWDDGSASIENACNRARVAFESIEKLGAPFYAFHDRDVAPESASLAESNRNLHAVIKVLKEEQERTGIKLLWTIACLFAHPRFAHGAATNPNAEVFAYAAAQVKKAMEVAHELGAEGYVFWGGREGHSTLWNTDMKRELEHLAKFLHLGVDYKKQIRFKGAFYIEPKPKEPTKHQYDFDAATCLNFLREDGMLEHFKLNLSSQKFVID
jgi:xylose isomerase